jgi:hypothetical protein
MDIWPPKQPGETVAYSIDWTEALGVPGPYYGDQIDTYTLTLTSGDAVVGVNEVRYNVITALISGGTSGVTSTFLNTINTVQGQILTREITLLVQDDSVPYAPSTATKRLVIDMAYDEVRLAVPEFQINPNELNTVLTKLDMLMDEWAASGIYLGYNAPTTPGDGDLDDEIGIPNAALHAVALYLALRVSPAFGKSLSAETKAAMMLAMSNLRGMTAHVPNMRLPRTTPLGQGNRWLFFNNFPFASGRGGPQ